MKRAMVTGATGYIGANLVKKLVELNISVSIIKRPKSDLARLSEIEGELSIYNYDGSTDSLIKAMNEFKPDVVFHLASTVIARHKTQDLEEMISSNILYGTQILESMKISGVCNIINTSTSWQLANGLKYNPYSLYTALKQSFEDIILFYTNVYPIKSISLRLPDVYGPNDNRTKVLNLIHKASNTSEILKMSAGNQEMDILYIDDIVNGFISSSILLDTTEEKFNVYSLSSLDPISLKNIVRLYVKINEVSVNIEWGALAYRSNEIMNIVLPDNVLPNWNQKVFLEEGLRKLNAN